MSSQLYVEVLVDKQVGKERNTASQTKYHIRNPSVLSFKDVQHNFQCSHLVVHADSLDQSSQHNSDICFSCGLQLHHQYHHKNSKLSKCSYTSVTINDGTTILMFDEMSTMTVHLVIYVSYCLDYINLT